MSIEVFSYLFTILCEVRHASIIGFLSSFNDGYRFTLFLVSYNVFIKLFSREFYVSEIYIYIYSENSDFAMYPEYTKLIAWVSSILPS